MKATAEQDERIARMTFASVYPHYVTKVEKKAVLSTSCIR